MKGGTIVWVNFDPVRGHEQEGDRPALVISEAPAWGMLIVVPLTSTPPRGLTHHRMEGERMSTARCEQVRSIDPVRVRRFAGEASAADLRAVREIVVKLITPAW